MAAKSTSFGTPALPRPRWVTLSWFTACVYMFSCNTGILGLFGEAGEIIDVRPFTRRLDAGRGSVEAIIII